MLVGRQYGLAMLTITPMALLMTTLGAGAGSGDLAVDRAWDTVLGALVAVVVVGVLRPHAPPAPPVLPSPALPSPLPPSPAPTQD